MELKLRKLEGLQWSSLETVGTEALKQPTDLNQTSSHDPVHKYPSSAHYTRDWDKLVADVKKEEKDEKLEGDAALNQLFQHIYKDGNEEVRKAMNKSFVSLLCIYCYFVILSSSLSLTRYLPIPLSLVIVYYHVGGVWWYSPEH